MDFFTFSRSALFLAHKITLAPAAENAFAVAKMIKMFILSQQRMIKFNKKTNILTFLKTNIPGFEQPLPVLRLFFLSSQIWCLNIMTINIYFHQ